VRQVARSGLIDPVLRIIEPVGIRHGIQVIQIAKELVEPMQARQELVKVAEVVFPELPSCVAKFLQRDGDRGRLIRHPDICSSLAHCRQASSNRQLAGDEVRTACRTACFGIIVRKQHPLRSQLVQIRRLSRHDPAVVGPNVEPSHIVAHNHQDVRFLLLRFCGGRCC
jgi:hypothetical protein